MSVANAASQPSANPGGSQADRRSDLDKESRGFLLLLSPLPMGSIVPQIRRLRVQTYRPSTAYHEIAPGAKAESMAGTTSSARRLTLPAALLVTLVAIYGGPDSRPSYVPEPGRGTLWECRVCGRVEFWPARGSGPRCDGRRTRDGEGTHRLASTYLVEEEGVRATDGQRW